MDEGWANFEDLVPGLFSVEAPNLGTLSINMANMSHIKMQPLVRMMPNLEKLRLNWETDYKDVQFFMEIPGSVKEVEIAVEDSISEDQLQVLVKHLNKCRPKENKVEIFIK